MDIPWTQLITCGPQQDGNIYTLPLYTRSIYLYFLVLQELISNSLPSISEKTLDVDFSASEALSSVHI